MGALDSINDKCWSLLDALSDKGIPIGEFFDKYNLPPILFPLMIVLVVLVIVWLLMAPAASSDVCGDGTCSPAELDKGMCESDCGGSGPGPVTDTRITVNVEIQQSVDDMITVMLYDQSNNPVSTSQKGRKTSFQFNNIDPQVLKASVICPNAKTISSSPQSVTSTNNIIVLPLPSGCFDVDNPDNPTATYGAVLAHVSDASNGVPLSGADVNVIRLSDRLSEESATTIAGEATINVRSGNRYYLTVTKAGYTPFNGDSNTFYMSSAGTENQYVQLTPLVTNYTDTTSNTHTDEKNETVIDPKTEKGILEVCVYASGEPLEGGIISINEVGGDEIDSEHLTSIDNGCLNFTISSDLIVKASLVSPPSDCTPPSPTNSITIKPGKLKSVNLTLECDEDMAHVKVMVKNKEGDLLTDKVKVTLWNSISGGQIRGTASDYTLSQGSSGYTEELAVPADTLIQARVTDVPLGYTDTNSKPDFFTAGDHSTIIVVLGEIPTEEFTFSGASIIFNPASPGLPVKVYVENITYNGTTLTENNSQVSVIIGDESYDAIYE